MKVRAAGRRGFSVLELSMATILTSLLAMLLATTWVTFGAPLAKIFPRCSLAQEAQLALAALARDLDGRLDNPTPQDQSPYALVGRIPSAAAPSWRLLADPSPLQLCFDGGANPDGLPDWNGPGGVDTVVSYAVQNGSLARTVEPGGPVIVVARKVESFVASTMDDHGNPDPAGRWVRLDLTLRDRDLKQTYSLVAYGP
jgi:type II secretory pathway component PulJ